MEGGYLGLSSLEHRFSLPHIKNLGLITLSKYG
jgi:hypothetical protein